MTLQENLSNRNNSSCELCTAQENLTVYTLPPAEEALEENSILVCTICHDQINNPELTDPPIGDV